ncbi:MAG TPA: tRNA (N(6)-L-threonylcarbamoyladenosine(37)-C(2))-methylthiotransferase MtaB [Tissierellia bacterium]|nr:tRNA (N(6)-L-threonylcarbamoyladenosine(37)-C(2))-methylthiotransferase MtaB [Tissierellia bacterium]
MTIKYHTLGCRVNAVETDRLKRDLAALGFNEVSAPEEAEVIVINTCSVTKQSDRKSAQLIRSSLRQQAKVIAMGCYVPEELFEEVLFIPNEDKHRAPQLISDHIGQLDETGSLLTQAERTRSFIKVQDGCNNFCSYCIIPYLRGRERSMSQTEILSEVDRALAGGHREVVLSGIHLSGYGRDTNTSLIELIEAIGQKDGIDRIRLGSLEQAIITPDFLDRLNRVDAFCPHFHLSLQSGSDAVLKRMNRHYTTPEFLDKMEMIREAFPEVAITTDIIVGFSGETEEEFQESIDFVKQARFSKVHVFPFSKREGTRAALLSDLPGNIKKERGRIMRELTEQIQAEILEEWIGREVEVLTEDSYGYTRHYLPVYYEQALEPNQLVRLKITGRKELSLYGLPIL